MTFKEAHELTGNTQLAYYVLAAEKLDIEYRVLVPSLFVEFYKNRKRWRIHKAITPLNDAVGLSLATYKNTSARVLTMSGIPVPLQMPVMNKKEVHEFIMDIGHREIVVKPSRGFGGKGVSILPQTKEYIDKAYDFAHEQSLSAYEPKVIVEEFIAGENYRLVVLGDEVIAAAHRLAAHVVGNSKDTIRVLIDHKNRNNKQLDKPEIKIDQEVQKHLKTQKMTLDSVPQKDQRVTLRFSANMTQGGTTRECLSEIHSSYKKLAVKATKAIGLKFSGVDVITPDITNPNVRFAINEVNHDPGLRIHYMPDEGKTFDVCLLVQQYILDNYNPL